MPSRGRTARAPFFAACLLCTAVLVAALAPAASAAVPEEVTARRMFEIKRLQRELLMRGVRHKIARRRAARWKPPDYRTPEARMKRVPQSPFTRAGARARPSGEEAGRPARPGRGTPEAAGIPGGPRLLTDPNVFVNDPLTDISNDGQSEPSIAAWGRYVVAAWNDGTGYITNGSVQGYATSVDSGATFVDMGTPPTPTNGLWTSDPVVTVNEKTGEFYYCALADIGLSTTAVAVVRGTFTGDVFTWDTPRVAGQKSAFNGYLDKCWIVADSSSGNLYVTYTDFVYTPEGDNVIFQRSTDQGVTWSTPAVLNPPAAYGLVQGPRPAVGPDGRLYVVWKEIGPTDVDFFRVRVSTNGGTSFQAQGTIASHYDNFGTGAPGFNRLRGIAFPAIAVDRSFGPRRGRVYVSWNESANWYDAVPTLGSTGTVTESEDNDLIGQADGFAPGNELSGSLIGSDVDYWSFAATKGVTYVFYCDDPAGDEYLMGIVCSDQTTQLTAAGDDAGDGTQSQSIMVWTAPTTDTYYFGIADGSGPYTVQTGIDPAGTERGRDQRDVFVTSSADGNGWNVPVRVNDDPGYFDNWLPEIAVDPTGTLWSAWYDWRDGLSTCGGASHVYMARSGDGGASWASLGPTSDVQTVWSSVSSNIIPNQGDYIGLYAGPAAVYPVWADGRLGNPDVVAAPLRLHQTQIAVQSVAADTNHVQVTWRATKQGSPASVSTGVYRRFGITAFDSVGTIASDASGILSYGDDDITAGVTYQYRLRLEEGGVSRFVGQTSAFAPNPTAPGVSLGSPYPNPTPRDVLVPISLTSTASARLTLFDLGGREVRALEVGWLGAGNHVVNVAEGEALRPGVYIVRLEQAGTTATRRVVVIP